MLKRLREDRAVTRRLSFPYVLALPQDYDALPDKRWPLVVMLHGAGERGDDYDVLCRHGFLRRAAAGEEFPFLLAAPQCPADKYWGGYIESLNDFLDGLFDRLRVDADRVYLTGLSMGGTGTWLWAMANPERFAAIAPVCGTGICWYGEALLPRRQGRHGAPRRERPHGGTGQRAGRQRPADRLRGSRARQLGAGVCRLGAGRLAAVPPEGITIRIGHGAPCPMRIYKIRTSFKGARP